MVIDCSSNKEINNFISVLDSTLRAESHRKNDALDSVDIAGAVPVVVEASEVRRGLNYRGDDVDIKIEVNDLTNKPEESHRYEDNRPGPGIIIVQI